MGGVYRVLLRLLPGRFRRRYGDEMARMFEEQWEESAWPARGWLVLRALRDVLWTAVVVRVTGDPVSPLAVEPGVSRGLLTGLSADVRVALRGLRRRPGFAAVAILTVGLGIGATTAVFSVVDATVLRGLGLPDEDRLVSIWSTFERQPGQAFLVSAAEFTDLSRDVKSFEHTGGWFPGSLLLQPVAGGPARVVTVANTVGDIYRLVGARTAAGRLPGASDNVVGAPPVALISHGLWQSAYGGDAGIVRGGTLTAGSRTVAIIGVLAPDVHLPGVAADVWVHAVLDPASWATDRSGHGLVAIASLRPGVPVRAVRTELENLERVWARRYAGQHSFGLDGHDAQIALLGDRVLGSARRVAVLLCFASGLLLLLACANVANLLLARSETRRSEVGVRIALGGSGARVARPVLLEGVVLGCAGGLVGLLLAGSGMPLMLRLAPRDLPGTGGVMLDARVVLFALALSLLTGVLFTLAPAWHAARQDPSVLLRSSGRGRTGASHGLRVLVASQVALATVLLAGASLLVRSLLALNAVNPGLDAASRAVLDLTLPVTRYANAAAITGFYDALQQRLESMDAVRAIAVVRGLPLRDAQRFEYVVREDAVDREDRVGVAVQAASAGYLRTLGIALAEGRDLAAGDRAGSMNVALVNRSAAHMLWPGVSAIGRRVRATFAPPAFGLITIVGVYDDVRSSSLSAEAAPEILLSLPQVATFSAGWVRNLTVVLQAANAPATVLPAVRAVVAAMDPGVAVGPATTMRDVLRASTAVERFLAALLSVFGALALIIAAVGVTGVVSFSVVRQTREFAIRNSLGARPAGILLDVLRTNAMVAGAATLAGTAITALAAPALRGFLFRTPPRDVLVLTMVPATLMLVALLAALAPALRASRVPPARALHESE